MQPVFLSTKEMSALIGISPHTLASYARRGFLQPTFRLPNQEMRWEPVSTIEALLTSDENFDVSSDIITKALSLWRKSQ